MKVFIIAHFNTILTSNSHNPATSISINNYTIAVMANTVSFYIQFAEHLISLQRDAKIGKHSVGKKKKWSFNASRVYWKT